MTVSQTVVEAPTIRSAEIQRGPSALTIAMISAVTFSMAGAFGQSLMATGWSPGALVLVRLALATVALLPLALRALRGRWRLLLDAWPLLVAYGALASAGCQLFYFMAVQRLSVSVALLLEYSSPLLIVFGAWALTRRAPGPLTLGGAALAMLGLALVLNIFHGVRLDAAGIGFGLLAAVGSATHFVVGARSNDRLPPIVLATGGLGIGALLLLACGLAGVLPLAASVSDVTLAGQTMPWWLPVVGVALISGSVAYASGIVASVRLGPRLASFVGLSEVLFACLMAWLLVGERPSLMQLAGGLVILSGIVLVKWDELRTADPVAQHPSSITHREPIV